jgi:hypothetical protein
MKMNEKELKELASEKINKYFYNRPELYKQILEATGVDPNLPRKEVIAIFRLGLVSRPICKNSKCGNFVKMSSGGKFRVYCCAKCSASSNETRQKCIDTNLEKYGTENVAQSKEIKEKIASTLKANHGSHHMKLSKYRKMTSDMNKTLDREKVTRSRYKDTYSKFTRFQNSIIPMFTKDEFRGGGYDKKYDWKCIRCNCSVNTWYHNGMQPKCPLCDKVNVNEDKLLEFVSKLGVTVSHCNRTVLDNLELDLYMPNEKLGIEFNGNYWHSEIGGKTPKSYHKIKTEMCNEKGIRLVHIFEDELHNKPTIVLDRIRGLLGKKRWKIYGRQCDIREIDAKTKNVFLNKYHLQGEDKSSIKLGLFHKDRLVSVMTFSKQRKCVGLSHVKGNWELCRFASIGKFSIVGGASKLLTYFKRNYEWNEIISYADLRWSEGGVYDQLGFKLSHTSAPNYWYVHTKNYIVREYRYKYAKHNLPKLLENFDASKSEWENMKAHGYDRIWDCGNLVYKLTK